MSFPYTFFCSVDTVFKGNKLSTLSITNILAKHVPNSLEIIAIRSTKSIFFSGKM